MGSVENATILVVEDDTDIRTMQQELLSEAGYKVHVAANGRDALAQLEQRKVDLVVLDIRLPDIDGITVCERIRAEHNASTPVLMLSANGTHESIAAALAAGADAYLIKPFVPDTLFEQLALLLQQ